MPTETSHAVRMHAISSFHSSLTTRLLHKGPEYLRKQMEAGNPGKKSAVERLAADKAKYVKSQQVISTKQEPVVATALSSVSESSSEGCSVESKKANGMSKQKCARSEATATTDSGLAPFERGPPIVRRSIGKRQGRPDSLVIYRQKCEFVRGHSQDSARGSLVRRLFQTSFKEKQLASGVPKVVLKEGVSPEAEETVSNKETSHDPGMTVQPVPTETDPAAVLTSRCENTLSLNAAPCEPKEVRRKGLHRSQSDISSRYSKSFSEFDSFFKYCGLDSDVVEDLGQENFSMAPDHFFQIRSISVATSESDFTRHSGDDGLLEEELTEQAPTGTSVIERNARIIKWLYTCKKAKEVNTRL